MANLDRRQWLRTAGLAGAFSMLGGGAFAREQGANMLRIVSNNTANGPLRLSANENPYGPSQKMRQAMMDAFDNMCRYPWGYARELVEALAKRHGVTNDHIVLTAGSGEGLKAAGLTYGLHGSEIVAAQPTYLALMEYAQQFGAYVHYVPLNEHLVHDIDAMSKRLTGNTRLVFVCNPNNPTGTLLPAARMKSFCENLSQRTVVFADEAYFDYVTEPGYPSMVDLVKQDLNVIVSRTFSKVYGMAGIRSGYLIARPDIAQRLRENTMAGPSVPAIAASLAALQDEAFYQFSLQKNAEALQIMYAALDSQQLSYVKSHANFVFFNARKPIQEIQSEFSKRGVQVGRPFPPLNTWCRVSTGTIQEVKGFAQVLREVV
ncbi:MAG TPA: histidinol-phosphate transaminase [Saprospiraceae bacterium]|nr:histidinol-phosphate transaminase [Saprospiraceae bacterium]HMP14636.1 histidinol-phosphate transaminase [Saprospiraceae bacterium]